MGAFEEMGRKLDEVAQRIRVITQEGVDKTEKEAKEWGKKLDEIRKTLKKMTQEGIEKFATQTKTLTQTTKLRSQIRDIERKKKDEIIRLGKKVYESELYKKLDNEELNRIGKKIAKLEEEIKRKEEEIQKLKK
ncbi:hypothetical protein J7K28_03015 [Candidatus Aerophobetes bacterium]|nr:hypothetical protein [Candidatus Aerophobetes bacterium]